MLDYEWGNPSPLMLSGDEPPQDSDHSRQILDHYHQSFADGLVAPSTAFFHHHHHHSQPPPPPPPHHHHHHHHNIPSLYDPRAFNPAYQPPPPAAMLSLDPGTSAPGATAFMVVPKSEEVVPAADFTARIGLNLGGRTYFSSEDDFVNRLYQRRSRPAEPGSVNSPRCQAEGCNADLTNAKHYHRRHKVCEFHSKASTVFAAGLTQRFCQQCSRFHLLSEFDNGKRSCRKRLADHNRRRRKSQQPIQDNHKPHHLETPRNSSSDNNITRSPPDSGAHSSSSVTVAVSPPRMTLECFRQRPYQTTASSASSSSLFFSSG